MEISMGPYEELPAPILAARHDGLDAHEMRDDLSMRRKTGSGNFPVANSRATGPATTNHPFGKILLEVLIGEKNPAYQEMPVNMPPRRRGVRMAIRKASLSMNCWRNQPLF
jgi:hypothetical protein